MVVISPGASIFQVNASKLRKPLETVDLEDLPDSRDHTRAPALWLFCEGRTNVWELFSDNAYLSAVFDRQGLSVAAPVELRTKKTESFSPQLLQGFWSKLKETESQDRCDVPDCHHQNLEAKRSHMATVPFVLGRSRISNLCW